MEQSAIKLEILRAGEEVIGFKLFGSGETHAEAFCYSFPSAQKAGKASVAIEGERIVFKHKGHMPEDTSNPMLYSGGGEFSADVSSEDAKALRLLLDGKGPYKRRKLRAERVTGFGYGFELKASPA